MAFSSGRAVPTISAEKEGGDIKVIREREREKKNDQSTSHTVTYFRGPYEGTSCVKKELLM